MHKLTLDNMEHALLVGVTDVLAMEDKAIVFTLGERTCQISGSALKILRFNKESGELELTGRVTKIDYAAKKPPLLKRLFK